MTLFCGLRFPVDVPSEQGRFRLVRAFFFAFSEPLDFFTAGVAAYEVTLKCRQSETALHANDEVGVGLRIRSGSQSSSQFINGRFIRSERQNQVCIAAGV